MDELVPSALFIGGTIAAYMMRSHIKRYAVSLSSLLIDQYVELKWRLSPPLPKPKEEVERHLPEEPIVLHQGDKHTRYFYYGREYITFGAVPAGGKLASVYDPDERITSISGTTNDEIVGLLHALAGPLCDFHGDHEPDVILQQLQHLGVNLHELPRIIINTENYKEYVIQGGEPR